MRSFTSVQDDKFANNANIGSTAILLPILYSFCSLAFCTFFKKVPKTGQSCTAFGASFVQELPCNIFQSVHTSPLAVCRNAWGGKLPSAMLLTLVAKLKQVLFHSLNRNIRCAQTSCHLLPSIARLLTVPPNAALPPLAGNYLFNGILLEF